MLTLFTIPKPFRGHIAVIQRNAIRSWTLLRPPCEIILFGDEEGTAETAQEFRLHHVPEVARNEYGTPLVNDLFEKAQRLATNDLLCYVNADIILMSDFLWAVEQVARRKHRFLMVGQRWNVEVKEPLDFEPHWEEQLRTSVTQRGKLLGVGGMDYFVFPRGLLGKIPPFAIGRPGWDNWMAYRARSLKTSLIDATQVVMAVHQNHDYAHNPQGQEGIRKGPEAKRNLELAGGLTHIFTLWDATHLLTRQGLKRAFNRSHVWRRLETLPIFHPSLRLPVRFLLKAIIVTRPVRVLLGLTPRLGDPGNA